LTPAAEASPPGIAELARAMVDREAADRAS
jgi:hypothetical protein